VSQILILHRQILVGDVLEKIREIPEQSIDTTITSPPYWGLRDYGVEGQWGLEPDFKDYLKKLDLLMIEIKRVLKDTGTVWVNLGDTYSGSNKGAGTDITKAKEVWIPKTRPKLNNIQAKSLMCIPDEFKVNCRNAGWHVRNEITWYKANAMPSSVKDRFTNKTEPIFFLAKRAKYYFNLKAVLEDPLAPTVPFNVRVRDTEKGRFLQKALDSEIVQHDKKGIHEKYRDEEQANVTRLHKDREGNPNKQDTTLGADGKPKANYVGFNDRWKKKRKYENEENKQYSKLPDRMKDKRNQGYDHELGIGNPNGKNPGDVFFINPTPFSEAHFATFPVALPLKILKCACPRDGIVLDPFFGSGSVGIAAEKLGRKWIGIELKAEYVQMARKRLRPFMNKKLI